MTAQYNGSNHYVILSNKLDFLWSPSSVETHTVDNDGRVDVDDGPEATTEDDFEIDSFFPPSLNYSDLSTFGLKSKILSKQRRLDYN